MPNLVASLRRRMRELVRANPRLKTSLIIARRRYGSFAARTHLAEAAVYARAVTRAAVGRNRSLQTKFIVYGQGRSGSSLLIDLLRSHPSIHCESEILHPNVCGRLLLPHRYIQARAGLSIKAVYGFKLKIYELTEYHRLDPAAFLMQMHEDGWKIIHLFRRDLFRKALSSVIAEQRGIFTQRRGESASNSRERYSVDPQQVLATMTKRMKYDLMEEQAIEDLPRLRVLYDDDLYRSEQHGPTSERIFKFLGLDPVPVGTVHLKTSHVNLADYIENHDELIAAVHAAGYINAR